MDFKNVFFMLFYIEFILSLLDDRIIYSSLDEHNNFYCFILLPCTALCLALTMVISILITMSMYTYGQAMATYTYRSPAYKHAIPSNHIRGISTS